MYQEYPQAKSASREIRFFSEIRKETYNLADVRKFSDEDIDFLLSEAWNTRVSLGLVSTEAHEKIAQGGVVDSRWLKRVKYKYKAVKAFMHGLREEKGLRYISQSPEIAAKLREELMKNDTPESNSVVKIDATVNAVLSFRARELGTFMELVTKEIGNQRFQELRKSAAEKAKLLGGQFA
jgi:hypothetical protein